MDNSNAIIDEWIKRIKLYKITINWRLDTERDGNVRTYKWWWETIIDSSPKIKRRGRIQ